MFYHEVSEVQNIQRNNTHAHTQARMHRCLWNMLAGRQSNRNGKRRKCAFFVLKHILYMPVQATRLERGPEHLTAVPTTRDTGCPGTAQRLHEGSSLLPSFAYVLQVEVLASFCVCSDFTRSAGMQQRFKQCWVNE